jgi:RNA polymerase sigma-70 factor (ECF subfamily)
VNSALQRARATLEANAITETDQVEPLDEDQRELLARYVDAFERYDLDTFVSLLSEDVRQSMPPYELWLVGGDQIAAWMRGPGAECEGSRLVATVANGAPAFGQYRPSGPNGALEPWALHVLEIADGEIVGLNFFLDTAKLFPQFGLPATIS